MGIELAFGERHLRPVGICPLSSSGEQSDSQGGILCDIFAVDTSGHDLSPEDDRNHYDRALNVQRAVIIEGKRGYEAMITVPLTPLELFHLEIIIDRDRRLEAKDASLLDNSTLNLLLLQGFISTITNFLS